MRVSRTAPISGPYKDPEPPNRTSSRMKIERWKVMKSEFTYWFCCATMAPAMPHVTAAMTKARIL